MFSGCTTIIHPTWSVPFKYLLHIHECYKQKQGATMGSPISPMVANLYMEHVESRALETTPTRPAMWYRYVDDTMTKIHDCVVSSLSDHLNSINPHIQFTSEEEKKRENSISWHLPSRERGRLNEGHRIPEPNHTDQYLNFHSKDHLQHKRAVVNTLLLRAHTLVSEEVDKVKEIHATL